MQFPLENLPLDVIQYEILPKMNYEELRSIAQTSTKYRELAKEQIPKYIASGGLQKEGWGPDRMYQLAKNSGDDVKFSVVKMFLERLRYRTPIYDYLKDIWESDEKFLFGPIKPSKKEIKDYIAQNPSSLLVERFNFEPKIKISNLRDQVKDDMASLFRNPNVTLTEILDYMTRNPNSLMSKYITINPNITPQDVLNNPHITWDKSRLSKYSNNFTIDFMRSNPNFPGLYLWDFNPLNSNLLPIETHVTFIENRSNPNFRLKDLVSLFPAGKIPNYISYFYYRDNINLKHEDISDENGNFRNRTESAAANPNLNRKDLMTKTSLWNTEIVNPPRDRAINSNFSPEEILAQPDWFDISRIYGNPNLTLDFVDEHPEIFPDKSVIASNKFTRSPKLRYLLYHYIYKLLPEQVTINVQGQDITADKDFLYGMLAAIFALKLDYDVSYQGFPLVPEDYKMFTDGTANHPYVIKLEGIPFHFTSPNFLSGVKEVYETNNVAFNNIQYYDKDNNWQLVRAQ